MNESTIRKLHAESLEAGDVRMAMICELALDGEYGWAEPGTEMDTLRREGWTVQQAHDEIERVLNEARAQG